MRGQISFDTRTAASAIDWWRLAGVDTIVEDAPRDWLRPVAKASIPAADRIPVKIETPLPDSLAALDAWLAEPANLPALGQQRIAAAGDPVAGIMIVSDLPDADDLATGALFAGPAGRLLDRMLAAIGRDRAGAYLVPLAPGRSASGRIDADLQATLAGLMRRRIALAAPRTLLLFGDATVRALVGTSLAEARLSERSVNHDAGNVPAIATFHPRFLLQQPARKADAWRDLLRLPEAQAQ